MCKRKVIVTIVLMLLIFATTSFAAADKYHWKLVDTEDDCQIYTSDVRGKDYIAAKTSCIIPAKLEVIGMVIRDIENYHESMEDCKDTKILRVVDDEKDVFIFWLRQHFPLFADRDIVLKSKRDIDKDGRVLIFTEATNEMSYDSGKGYVRIPSLYSLCTLEWVDREHTKVTYMIDADLGKGMPAVIANIAIKSIPYKSLRKMMKMVKKSKYIEAAKTSKYKKMVEELVKAGHS